MMAVKKLGEMTCSSKSILCGTIASIIDKKDPEYFDVAVDLLWQLRDDFPPLIPFPQFGNLVVDLLLSVGCLKIIFLLNNYFSIHNVMNVMEQFMHAPFVRNKLSSFSF